MAPAAFYCAVCGAHPSDAWSRLAQGARWADESSEAGARRKDGTATVGPGSRVPAGRTWLPEGRSGMPLLVPTEELQPGMQLHEPIVTNGQVMLQGGRALTETDVEVIARRFPGMSVRVVDPVLDSVIEFEDDSRDRRIAGMAQQRVSECMQDVKERFAGRTSLYGVQFGAIYSTVNELMVYLRANTATAALVTTCMDPRSYLGVHAGNVFYLSMLLGSKVLEYVATERRKHVRARGVRTGFATDLAPLGLAALLMDLGMCPLEHLLRSDQPLTDDSREAIRQHPEATLTMLPYAFSPVARVVIRTHHENCCGTGYPQGLAGEKLHVFARIVRIADAYDAATSDRVYRNAKSPARVLWEMTAGPYHRFYDPKLVHAFARLIQPFPIGSKLRLQDGRFAAVVRYNRADPFDPLVVVAFDRHNRPLPKEQLEGPLRPSARRDLRLAALNGEQLSFLYTTEPPTRRAQRVELATPLQAAYP